MPGGEAGLGRRNEPGGGRSPATATGSSDLYGAVSCGIVQYSRFLFFWNTWFVLGTIPKRLSSFSCDDRTAAPIGLDDIRVRPVWRIGDPTSMAPLARVVSNEDPEVVVIQYHRGLLPSHALMELLSDSRLRQRVVVVTLHAARHLLDLDPNERELVVDSLRRVSRLLVHRIAVWNYSELGLSGNASLFPQGASPPAIMPPVRALTRLGPSPLIGSHGFLPGEGIPRLIEAVAKLRGDWRGLRLRLVRCGISGP